MMATNPDPKAIDLHSLRTHLTLVKGYTQLAHRQAKRINDSPTKLIAYLETVLTHTEHMAILLAEPDTPQPLQLGEGSDGSD